ncbi:MAG TPA: hypothetical protein VML55_05175 [Planctomycetaceae bacterium]|nr:hypothetical protein [Planctomycetaceae bacterium]
MDQLKPLLKHKFWILFGFALILPIVGWLIATGRAKAEIDQRIATIAGTNVQSGADAPNEKWTGSLEEINTAEQQKLDQAAAYLWQQQKDLMVWPRALRQTLQGLAYRDPIPPQALNVYGNRVYLPEYELLRRIVRPYEFETQKGIVALEPNVLPIHPNYNRWVSNVGSLTSDEMWDAQEDLWLLAALLKAIDNTNRLADAKSITDAWVRRIDTIELRGGSRAPAGGTSPGAPMPGAGGQAGGAMPEEGGHDFDYSDDSSGDEGGGFDGGGGFGGGAQGVGFDPTEEFGSDADNSAASAGQGGGGATGMNAAASRGNYGAQGASGSGQRRRRYIDNEDVPFRTRGFYIEVVMDHTKLPELLGELTSSPWPVEIVRVQQGELASSGAGGGGSARAGGGMGRGGLGGGMGGAMGGAMPGMAGGGRAAATPGGGNRGGNPFGRPPAANRPMGPMGQQGGPMGRSPMGGAQQRQATTYVTAMQDPSLAKVAIAGLMTLFENPKVKYSDGLEAAAPAAAPAAQPAAATANGTLPAEAPASPEPAETLPESQPGPEAEGVTPDGLAPAPDSAEPSPDTPPDAAEAPAGEAPPPGELPADDASQPPETPAAPTGDPAAPQSG